MTELSLVPLVLSYSTIVLSSYLILPSAAAAAAGGAHGKVVRLVLVPLFTSASFTMIGVMMGVVSEALVPVALAAAFSVSQTSHLLGTVQATSASLLTLKLALERTSGSGPRGRVGWGTVLKVYVPLLLLSLGVESSYGVVYSYALMAVLVKGVYPRLMEWELRANARWIKVLAAVSFLCLYGYGRAVGAELQPLMIFVFLGGVAVFSLSLRDLPSRDDEKTLSISKSIVLACGLMAIVLQYLSFNTIASTSLSDVLTLSFTVVCAAIVLVLDRAGGADSRSAVHAHEHGHEPGHEHQHSQKAASDSIIGDITTSNDTRSIFSYLLLNTTFMFVQLLYSFRSKSLGLLSDSLHMALDCTSLLLGLIAGVLSKRPPSDKFPFTLKYLETLAAFTNGVLLLGIVCGIFIQAVERILNPIHIHGTNELLVVATLGLFVNLIGLFAFDHAGHSHGGSNENMRGIFLHILADTLGSVGVVVSTILIKWTHIQIFDPIASLFIGALVLLSAIPLLKSTSCSILLKLDDKKTNLVKTALNQISVTPGITGYTTPRFWSATPESSGHSHAHGHSEAAQEANVHSNAHLHSDSHLHSHSHSHGHGDHCEEGDETSNKKDPALVGYIHIQYMDGENSTIIKKRAEKIFEGVGIRAWIQVEPSDSPCWCRPSSTGGTKLIESQVVKD